MYSLVKRTAEIEILPLAKEKNLGVISYSPLGGGLLTGKYSSGGSEQDRINRQANYAKRYQRDRYKQTAENFTDYAKKAGVHPVTLAVSWVKSNPAVTAPIMGARNTSQLKPALDALEYRMSGNQYREISNLAPPVPLATDRDEEL